MVNLTSMGIPTNLEICFGNIMDPSKPTLSIHGCDSRDLYCLEMLIPPHNTPYMHRYIECHSIGAVVREFLHIHVLNLIISFNKLKCNMQLSNFRTIKICNMHTPTTFSIYHNVPVHAVCALHNGRYGACWGIMGMYGV